MLPAIDVVGTGERIKELRMAKGFKVSQVAKILGFNTPQAVYRWEYGKSLPTIENLMILAVIFDVKVDDILVVARYFES